MVLFYIPGNFERIGYNGFENSFFNPASDPG